MDSEPKDGRLYLMMPDQAARKYAYHDTGLYGVWHPGRFVLFFDDLTTVEEVARTVANAIRGKTGVAATESPAGTDPLTRASTVMFDPLRLYPEPADAIRPEHV